MRLRRTRDAWLKGWGFTGFVLIGTSFWRVAAVAPELPDALQACTQERDDSRRLACYDREMARLSATVKQSFGLSTEQERKLESPEPREKPKPQILSSAVSAVSMRPDGRQVITLATGGTWVQGEAWEVFHVRVGDVITIKPGVLGSFYMYTPSGSAMRVTRMR